MSENEIIIGILSHCASGNFPWHHRTFFLEQPSDLERWDKAFKWLIDGERLALQWVDGSSDSDPRLPKEWNKKYQTTQQGFQMLERKRKEPSDNECKHGPDFRSIVWYGKTFSLTANQAHVVEVLWAEWENGTPDVAWETIQEKKDISSRIVDVFKDCSWFNELIEQGGSKGAYRMKSQIKS